MPCRLFVFAGWWFLTAGVACAHDAGVSHASARLTGDELRLVLNYDLDDLRRLLPKSAFLGTDTSPLTITAAEKDLRKIALRLIEVRIQDVPLDVADLTIGFNASDDLSFNYLFPHPDGATVEFVFPALAEMTADHRQRFTFTDANQRLRADKMLTASDFRVTVSTRVLPPESTDSTIRSSSTGFGAGELGVLSLAGISAGALGLLGWRHFVRR